ncbi:MAG: hypothetical protein HY744_13320 [Deltaproteobacteria bacterium]|nr:hypothetical protein [Deltaproteobacteria bacterium]
MTIEEEQRAFEGQLDQFLGEHPGEFVLFKDGQPVEFFRQFGAAYAAGVARYGLRGVFLVGEVVRLPVTTSLSWQLGVM